jgi:2-haloalkanoic acid dehalogenase type II
VLTAVIFDVYETLFQNTTSLWIETFREICREQGLGVNGPTLFGEWKALEMGFRRVRVNLDSPEKSPPFKTYRQAWEECFRGAFERLGLKGDPARATDLCVRDMGLRQPYRDAMEVLPKVQGRWRTALLSNADDAYLLPLLERHNLRFEAVLSSEAARAYKPHPSAFLRLLERLGVSPSEALFVGDSLFDDILGARRVGMRTVWVNRNGLPPDPSLPPPDYEVKELTGLPPLLEALTGRES